MSISCVNIAAGFDGSKSNASSWLLKSPSALSCGVPVRMLSHCTCATPWTSCAPLFRLAAAFRSNAGTAALTMSLALDASRTLNGSAGVESEPKPSKICFSVSLSSAFGFSFSWIIGFDASARSRIRTLPGTPPWMLFRLRPRNPIWPTMSSVPLIFASAENSVALGTRKMRSLSVVPAPGAFRSTPSFRCQSKLGSTVACAPTESTLVRPTPFSWSPMFTCALTGARSWRDCPSVKVRCFEVGS